MAGEPAAPQENNGAGSKMIFLSYDGGGSNLAAIMRAYQIATIHGTVHGDIGVYPTSGLPQTGYIATSGGSEEPLSGSPVPCQGVLVKADPDNGDDVFVGPTGITNSKASGDGYRLAPGESVGVPCRSLDQVFILRGLLAVDVGVYFSTSID